MPVILGHIGSPCLKLKLKGLYFCNVVIIHVIRGHNLVLDEDDMMRVMIPSKCEAVTNKALPNANLFVLFGSFLSQVLQYHNC